MQIELRRSCQNILLKDSHDIFSRLVGVQGRGIRVNLQPGNATGGGNNNVCRVCRQSLLGSDSGAPGNSGLSAEGNQPALMVFRCSHAFHKDCLARFGRYVACPVCVQEGVVA